MTEATQLPVHRESGLSIRADQDEFNAKQVEALKKMNGWQEAPDAELSVFFHQAKRTGLDPFARQIYLIGRGGRNGKQYTIQTGIDGYRLIADRTGKYAGSDAPEFGQDKFGNWCKKTVWKFVGGEKQPFTAMTYEKEYAANNNMWQSMPRNQHAKCTEALALRMAFPADLSGIYADDEMQQADSPTAPRTVEARETTPRGSSGALKGNAPSGDKPSAQDVRNLYKSIPEGDRPSWDDEVWPLFQSDPAAAMEWLDGIANGTGEVEIVEEGDSGQGERATDSEGDGDS